MANMIILNKVEELRPVAAAYCRLTGGAKNSGRNLYKKICNWCLIPESLAVLQPPCAAAQRRRAALLDGCRYRLQRHMRGHYATEAGECQISARACGVRWRRLRRERGDPVIGHPRRGDEAGVPILG